MIFLNYSIVSHAQMECPVDKIYPQSADFSGDDCGRILINRPTGSFYTNYQTQEGEIRIKAVLGSEYVGETVYFRIIDPDDMSPYETDIIGDDNGDMMGYRLISHNTAVNVVDQVNHIYSTIAVEGIEDEEGTAVSEVILKFTDYYSGDNYKVLCNTDPLVPIGNSAETICMVAWKRHGIERYSMYKKGSFLSLNVAAGATKLNVSCFDYNMAGNSNNDFNNGDNMIIWGKNLSGMDVSEEKQISNIMITISDLGVSYEIILTSPLTNSFQKYSGIRPTSDDDVYAFNENELFLLNAYGKSSCGEEGGVFVEYEYLSDNPTILPSADFNCISLPYNQGGFAFVEQNNWNQYKAFQEY